MFFLNCIKLFLSLNGKTSQQTKQSSLAIAKCSMMILRLRQSEAVNILKMKLQRMKGKLGEGGGGG